MNYNEIEKQLLNQSKKLLDEYKKLYINTLQYAHLYTELEKQVETKDVYNFIHLNCTNEDINKAIRLVAAMCYVENPTDKEIISNLKGNIKTNCKKKK